MFSITIKNEKLLKELRNDLLEIKNNELYSKKEKEQKIIENIKKQKEIIEILNEDPDEDKLEECVEYVIDKIRKNYDKYDKLSANRKFRNGLCNLFVKMLYNFFEEESQIYLCESHVIIKIGKNFYDIRGNLRYNLDDFESYIKQFHFLEKGIYDEEYCDFSDLCSVPSKEDLDKINKIVDEINVDEKYLELKEEYSLLKEQKKKKMCKI